MNEEMAEDPANQGSTDHPEDQRRSMVAAAIAGDEGAADELVALLAPELMGMLEGQMGPKLMRYLSVTDIAQESLTSLVTSLDQLPPQASLSDLRNLLFQYARWNVMRHGSGAGRFQGESVCERISREDHAQERDRSTGEVTLEDEVSWLKGLIEEMPPDLGSVMLKRLEGHSFAALALEFELGESAVRKRFDRALVELQRLAESRKHRDH